MATTYYKYAERDAENQIDWGQVGADMNKVISDEMAVRREKKKKISEEQQASDNYVQNAPQLNHEGYEEYMGNYSEAVMETMRIQNQLLKEGKLSLKDYNIQRANIMNGTETVFEVAKEWNVKFLEAKEQMDSPEGLSNFDANGLMNVEKMGNYDAHSLYINPVNGKVSVGERQLKDPDQPHDPIENPYTTKVVENENSLIPINQVNSYFENIRPPLDVRDSFADSVSTLAETYEVLMNSGYNKVDDIRQHKDYTDAKESMINAILGGSNATNSFDAQSLLTDYQGEIPEGFDNSGEAFIFTEDPNDPRLHDENGNRNQYVILKVPNPDMTASGSMVPQLTEEQLEMAKHIASETLDTMVNSSVTERTEFSPQQWQYKVDEKGKIEQALLQNLLDLYSGEHADIESTMIGLMDLPGNEWIMNMDRTNEGIVINKGLPNEEVIPLWDDQGNAWTETQFIKALAAKIGGIDDLGFALEVFDINNKDREVLPLRELEEGRVISYTRGGVVEGPQQLTPTSYIMYNVDGEEVKMTTDSLVTQLENAHPRGTGDDALVKESGKVLDALMNTWLKGTQYEPLLDDIEIYPNTDRDYVTIKIPGFIVDSDGNNAEIRIDIDDMHEEQRSQGVYNWMENLIQSIKRGETVVVTEGGDQEFFNDQSIKFQDRTSEEVEEDEITPMN